MLVVRKATLLLLVGQNCEPRATQLSTSIERNLMAQTWYSVRRLTPQIQEQKKHHDQYSRLRQFLAGQLVMAREFRSQDKWLPGVIQSQSGPVSYDVELENGKIVKRHIDHLQDRSVPTKPSTPVDSQPEDSTQGFESFNDSPSVTSSSTLESNLSPNAAVRRYPQREHHPPERLMNIHI